LYGLYFSDARRGWVVGENWTLFKFETLDPNKILGAEHESDLVDALKSVDDNGLDPLIQEFYATFSIADSKNKGIIPLTHVLA